MDRRDVSSPRALAAIEKARKLLNLAYDKAVNKNERVVALSKAEAALKPFGLTVEDLKQESTPDYLRFTKQTGENYSAKGATAMASILKRGGWKPIDPATEAYRDYRGDPRDETEE